MKETNGLIGGAIAFVVTAVILMVGGSVLALTSQAAVNVSAATNYNGTHINSSTVAALGTATGNTLTTFGNFLPIIAIAIVGGLAVGALIQFGGFTSRG